jgi:hypothetical protein
MAEVERPHEEVIDGKRSTVIGGLNQISEVQIIDQVGRVVRKTVLRSGLLLSSEGWGSTDGNFAVGRRVGEGRPLCLFDLRDRKQLFDVQVPYGYPLADVFVDEQAMITWLSQFPASQTARGPFEIGLDDRGEVLETQGDAEVFRRVAERPDIVLPKRLTEYDTDAVRLFYEHLRDLRAIGRDTGATVKGLVFEARMLKQMLPSKSVIGLTKLMDHLSFLLESNTKIRITARDASLLLDMADNLGIAFPTDERAAGWSAELRQRALESEAYQRERRLEGVASRLREFQPAGETVPSVPRVIDYLWETGEAFELVAAGHLKKMLKSLGLQIPSGAKADEIRNMAQSAPASMRELLARHLAIMRAEPEDNYLLPLRLDVAPLVRLDVELRTGPEFRSEGLARGRANVYHCQAYLVDEQGRRLFLGFGRIYHPDGQAKDVVIDACVWLQGGYYGIRQVPRSTFWRRTVPSEAAEYGEEFDRLFIRFLAKVKALGFKDDPNEARPVRLSQESLGLGVSIEIDLSDLSNLDPDESTQ